MLPVPFASLTTLEHGSLLASRAGNIETLREMAWEGMGV